MKLMAEGPVMPSGIGASSSTVFASGLASPQSLVGGGTVCEQEGEDCTFIAAYDALTGDVNWATGAEARDPSVVSSCELGQLQFIEV
jgi:CBS-domain-containing membrane protein